MEFFAFHILSLQRSVKRIIVFFIDSCICVLATWLAFYLRLDEFVTIDRFGLAALLSLSIALPIFASFGLYRAIFRYAGWAATIAVGRAMLLYGLMYATIVIAVSIEGVPRTVGVIQPIVLFFGVSGIRLFARYWLGGLYLARIQSGERPRVMIYGAGVAGRQLGSGLASGNELQLVGYFDDDSRLVGRSLDGFKIFSPDDCAELINSKGVTHVLLAMPSISRVRKQQIVEVLSQYGVFVRTLPSVSDIATGRVTVNEIRDLGIDELLCRDVVEPDQELLEKRVSNKTVLVTGAGGSIGSELCRQILILRPKILILFEVNEFSLYTIHSSLVSAISSTQSLKHILIVPLLGSVQDSNSVRNIFSKWSLDTIFHAAAYKHVPLVEDNCIEGAKNNVFGTLTLANSAIDGGVSDFVLVSTDKAVRPTNVMGATKRLSEMILQALDEERLSDIRFSIVRFGNVLESSGSVIPRFRSQIRAGGPVTVTHPEVNRFFMTIPEAAQLVIQASALAEGGDVFILEMGQPIKILELARKMIALSGLTEKTLTQPDGDIEIEIIGLRPGEKLYEELLIDEKSEPTSHPKISRATESFIPWKELQEQLAIFQGALDNNDVKASFSVLNRLVKEFKPLNKFSNF
jgi:FlaA1/EpsC-like NDP-sugar epimerase